AAWQRVGHPSNRGLPRGNRALHLFGFGYEAMRAGLPIRVAGVRLIGDREWFQAIETLRVLRFRQAGIDTDAFVEHEAFARVMFAAAVFEVFQNSAFELEYLSETF